MGDMHIHALSEKAFENGYKNLIATLMGALGITESPSQPAHEFIIYSLKHKFQMLSFAEIKLAFNLNAAGEFGEPIKAYQLLNMDFFGAVMAKYNERRQLVVLKTTPKALPEAAISAEQRAENNKKLLQSICAAYDAFQVNPSIEFKMSFLYLQELTERGIIPQGWNEDESYFNRAKQIRLNNLKAYKPDFRDIKQTSDILKAYANNKLFKGEHAEIVNIAKDLVLREYFKKFVNENKDLRKELIKK